MNNLFQGWEIHASSDLLMQGFLLVRSGSDRMYSVYSLSAELPTAPTARLLTYQQT